ncbi:SCP domain-containing protein, partial [Durusdinium trenchii]
AAQKIEIKQSAAPKLHGPMPPKVATPHAKLYRELAEKELELKDLEKQHEALVELQRQLPLMRNRLQGFQKARASREEAVRSLIEERQAELLEVNHEIQVLEAIAEASERIYPDLKTAQPLGESLHLAVEDMKNLHSSKPKGLSMRQPASWPSTFILADLMLACSEISATDAFISSTPFQGVDRMRLDAPGRDNEFL